MVYLVDSKYNLYRIFANVNKIFWMDEWDFGFYVYVLAYLGWKEQGIIFTFI
jgi:hypothetical protein